jgi:hypothetical protein
LVQDPFFSCHPELGSGSILFLGLGVQGFGFGKILSESGFSEF